MNIIQKRNIFLGFSAVVVLASWMLLAAFGLKPGIDLRGGTQWDVAFLNANVTEEGIVFAIKTISPELELTAKHSGENDFLIRLPDISEDQHQIFRTVLEKQFGVFEEKSFSTIGPTIGAELRTKAFWAVAAVLLGISLYIAWAFRKVSEPVKSWKYGVVTLVTLLHDVSIPAGLLALLGYLKGIEIDTNFIVALLVVMGFSVHDTIVVFDRIRENLLKNRGKLGNFGDIVNQSVHETFARSVNTSLTLFLVLVALMVVGPSTLFYFILTILIGTVFGTYSSIFVASPLLYLWEHKPR